MTFIKNFFKKLIWEWRNKGGAYDDFDNTLVFAMIIVAILTAFCTWGKR